MSMSGTRLKSNLEADILAQLQANFPVGSIPGGLLAQEQIAYNAGQVKLANSIADAVGPDTITEITSNGNAIGVSTGASNVSLA